MKFGMNGMNVQHLRQMSLLTFDRSRSTFKGKSHPPGPPSYCHNMSGDWRLLSRSRPRWYKMSTTTLH